MKSVFRLDTMTDYVWLELNRDRIFYHKWTLHALPTNYAIDFSGIRCLCEDNDLMVGTNRMQCHNAFSLQNHLEIQENLYMV